jgi:hypothetical protein
MVWGAISGDGVGPLERCDGIINQHIYKEVLDNNKDYFLGRTLAQDNAPCHKTQLIRTWLEKEGIETMAWPSCSPDLNPIEEMWHVMKRQIQGKHFPNKDALWCELLRLWFAFTPEFIRRFIDSMPDRVRAVINAKGGATRY